MPELTVSMPAYNTEKYIREAINNVLRLIELNIIASLKGFIKIALFIMSKKMPRACKNMPLLNVVEIRDYDHVSMFDACTGL